MSEFKIIKKIREAENYFEYYFENGEGSKFWAFSSSDISDLEDQLIFFGQVSFYQVSEAKEESIVCSEKIFSGKAVLRVIEVTGKLQKDGLGVIGNLKFDLSGLPGDIKVGDYFEVHYTGLSI
jgi:hypothetical protein